jgi:hydrogenase-4 component B
MNTAATALMFLAPGFPLVMAFASVAAGRPARFLPWAALPGLFCALLVAPGTAAGMPPALLGAELRLDPLGAVFLGFCALLWTCAGVYAQDYVGGKPRERSFCVFWHLTLAGSLGVCLAADVISFYMSFAFLSLAAYVLVVHDREKDSLRAGRIYIALALFGEIALLLGLMMGVHAAGSILIDPVRHAIPDALWREFIVAGLLLGLGLKAGLVPLHGWLPLAHSAAPVPASAVLSGAIVKAGILGLLRFLPIEGALPVWPVVLTWLGLLTAYAGVLLGLPQEKPKAVLAYSTMSQMGLLVAVIGAGIASPGANGIDGAAALYGLHHGLAKGGLFLCVGLLALGTAPFRRAVLAVAALLGAAMAGLPLTGGALAKLAVKGPLGEGVAALLAAAAAVGTMLLMLRFLYLAAQQAKQAPRAANASWRMTAAFAAVSLSALVLPWLLFPRLVEQGLGYALDATTLWSGLWPIGAALLLAAFAVRLRLPAGWVPVGDLASWSETAWALARVGAKHPLPPTLRVEGSRLALLYGRLWSHAEAAGARLSDWAVGAASLVGLAFLVGWALS